MQRCPQLLAGKLGGEQLCLEAGSLSGVCVCENVHTHVHTLAHTQMRLYGGELCAAAYACHSREGQADMGTGVWRALTSPESGLPASPPLPAPSCSCLSLPGALPAQHPGGCGIRGAHNEAAS
ncbi:zinc finger MYND domain-containing protein 19 [Platysternon megacephalum]|uniref:Zinc finger MYND domain-containing protein 19 n=1 Tax=Platysternon megacephalum TaxID=55544 RepID=A0A4D9DWU0_9SAUR|nr:zinc finger MYND domain-containing protein 19 [Platysternon megacephalum]